MAHQHTPREEYDAFEKRLKGEHEELERPVRTNSRMLNILSDLDTLYSAHTRDTKSTAVVERDQHAFKSFSSVVLQRMKNQARGSVGEISIDSLITGICTHAQRRMSSADDQETQSTSASKRRAGSRQNQMLGLYLYRGGHMCSLSPLAPTFTHVSRSEQVNRGERIRPPSATIQQTADSATSPRKQTSDRRQLLLQKIVLSTVLRNENNSPDYKPILLDKLCFDPILVNTIENYFTVCTLVKEQKLWVGSADGLPVVGTFANREKYEAANTEVSGPTQDSDTHERQQINISLDRELYQEMKDLFKEAMIDRSEIERNSESVASEELRNGGGELGG